MVEKRFLGGLRILLILGVIVVRINIFLSLVFRLTLEVISFKIFIYLLLLFFFCLRIMTNLNFKIKVYDKFLNFSEIWRLQLYRLDKFVY